LHLKVPITAISIAATQAIAALGALILTLVVNIVVVAEVAKGFNLSQKSHAFKSLPLILPLLQNNY
jgi:uncharacterized membrane protein